MNARRVRLRLFGALVLAVFASAGLLASSLAFASPEAGWHVGARAPDHRADLGQAVGPAPSFAPAQSGLPAETAVFGCLGTVLALIGSGWIVVGRLRRPTLDRPVRRPGSRRHRPLPSRARVPARTGAPAVQDTASGAVPNCSIWEQAGTV